MLTTVGPLGLGLGWRDELAGVALGRRDLRFVEVVAESVAADRRLPVALEVLRRRGVAVVPHGVQLSLAGAERPDPARLAALAALAERVEAPLVSEHIAFVRAGGLEAGHLLPVPRTRAALDVAVANVSAAMEALPIPLALEPIAGLVEWPVPEMDEGDFVTELLERTGALLLLDVANLYANARNHGGDAMALLDRLPLDRLAYVHVAGGIEADGVYHDSHAHPVPSGVLDLLRALADRREVPAVMIERDARFSCARELDGELDAVSEAARIGQLRSRSAGLLWRDRPPPRWVDAPKASRSRVAADQRALVCALVGGAEPPPGFDPGGLAATAAVLAAKRRTACH